MWIVIHNIIDNFEVVLFEKMDILWGHAIYSHEFICQFFQIIEAAAEKPAAKK